MRRLLQKIFRPFFVRMADRFASAPKQEDVFKSLSRLLKIITTQNSSRGIVVDINIATDHFIIFSDQHKGNKNRGDDFKDNEANYIAALKFYHTQSFNFINLGDAEELWKYKADKVMPRYADALLAEANFQAGKKYFRTFGNHDLLWKNKLDVALHFKPFFQMPLPIYEGLVLKATINNEPIQIFLTHGHQGDKMSDNNAISTWLVAHIWAPVQRFLDININTPSNDFYLRDKHNRLMYEWSSRRNNMFLITGHTHKPVFASGKYSPEVSHTINTEENRADIKPTYFNTGCCCYNDGDITGIEIADGSIRLIKWYLVNSIPQRLVLEERRLADLISKSPAPADGT
ncbi:MAG: metallophosphoesterase [Ferruginibacter sp.]|nr:metallophosphoesterase [Ferruginibacter sp.]